MTNKCGSDGRPPLGVSGGPSTLHAMVQHGFLNEGCTTRYSWLAQFQGYKPLMYGIKPDYVRSVTKNGTSKCIAAPNLNIQLSISLDYKKHLKLHQFLWPSKWPPATSLVMIPDDPRIGQKLDPIWSHVLINHQPNIMTIMFFNGKSPYILDENHRFYPNPMMKSNWKNVGNQQPLVCWVIIQSQGSMSTIVSLIPMVSPSYAHHFAIHWCPLS